MTSLPPGARTDDPWEAATFDGLERVQRRAQAASTPQQRLDWLGQAKDLALASGALTRTLAAKQRKLNALWAAATRKNGVDGGPGPMRS